MLLLRCQAALQHQRVQELGQHFLLQLQGQEEQVEFLQLVKRTQKKRLRLDQLKRQQLVLLNQDLILQLLIVMKCKQHIL
jgi:hypothetical protein